MALLDRIANYFKEWDGIDETAPKMELNIHELRYIADMNVERCRLIRQLNEANLKTEEIRAKAIDEFAVELKNFMRNNVEDAEYFGDCCCEIYESEIDEIAEHMKGGVE